VIGAAGEENHFLDALRQFCGLSLPNALVVGALHAEREHGTHCLNRFKYSVKRR
jgi:hypothetical protein